MNGIRQALRQFQLHAGVSAAIVLTLALGIGATTAIFSAMNATLLRPLPYHDWQDLRTLRTRFTDGNVTSGLVAPVELSRLNDPDVPIVGAAGSVTVDATLILDDATPLSVAAESVSEGFFELFGLPHTIGPGFSAQHHLARADFDVFVPASDGAVVISHRLWQDVLGGDAGIIGKTLRFGERDFSVVAVAARDMDLPRGTDVWFSLQLNPESLGHYLDGYLRVRPGTSADRLRSVLDSVAAGLERDYGGPETNRAFVEQPLVHAMVGDLRPMLVLVLSATGLLLLLACVNVTNLLLARGAGRMREMAMRSALGADRGRLVRQMLTESAVLAAAGAVVGVPLAYLGVRALLAYGAAGLPRLETVPFDATVLLFAAAMLLVSAVVVGVAPSLQATGARCERLLAESGRALRGTRSTHRALRIMIVAEVAVAVTLVAGAGWLVSSFRNLQTGDPGFAAAGRLVFDLSLPFERYGDAAERSAWTRTLLANLRGLPGVTAAGTVSSFPMRPDGDSAYPLQIDGRSDSPMIARMRVVSPGFFEAMGIPLRRGRAFTEVDGPGAAPVTIVNETFARRFMNDRDPTGSEITWGFPAILPDSRTAIVGVVGDVKHESLWSAPEPAFYLVRDQVGNFPQTFRMSVVVATDLVEPSTLAPAVRTEVDAMDPLLAVDVVPVQRLVEATLTRQRLGMTLMLLFGAVAVTLAAIGIYGVIAYASTERRGEVATRMALGATPSSIFWLLARQGRGLAALGGLLGLGGAYVFGRVASTWLYGVSPSDPVVLGGALAVVLVAAGIATLIPARRTSRTEPAQALRDA